MTDTRYPISGNIRLWFVPENGLANPAAPTEAEIAAALDISDAVSWNDKDLGIQASGTVEDPAITAKGRVQARGAASYGGGLSFYYPADRTDTSSIYVQVENALGKPGIKGYVIERVDGVEALTSVGNAAHPGVLAKAGDFITVYKVETAGFAQSITGEEAFRYTVSFLSKGFVKSYAIVRANATAAVPTITGAATGAIGKAKLLVGTLVGREYTRGLKWKTTTPNLVSVRAGVVIPRAAGAASIVAVDPATNTPSTAFTFTVS